jgi:hypothetical protein
MFSNDDVLCHGCSNATERGLLLPGRVWEVVQSRQEEPFSHFPCHSLKIRTLRISPQRPEYVGSVAKLLSQGFQNSGEAPSRFQCLRRGRTGRRVIHAIYQAAEYHGIAVTSYYYCVHIGGPGVPSVLLALIQSYVMKCIFTRICMYVFTDICSMCIVILMIRFVCIYTCVDICI